MSQKNFLILVRPLIKKESYYEEWAKETESFNVISVSDVKPIELLASKYPDAKIVVLFSFKPNIDTFVNKHLRSIINAIKNPNCKVVYVKDPMTVDVRRATSIDRLFSRLDVIVWDSAPQDKKRFFFKSDMVFKLVEAKVKDSKKIENNNFMTVKSSTNKNEDKKDNVTLLKGKKNFNFFEQIEENKTKKGLSNNAYLAKAAMEFNTKEEHLIKEEIKPEIIWMPNTHTFNHYLNMMVKGKKIGSSTMKQKNTSYLDFFYDVSKCVYERFNGKTTWIQYKNVSKQYEKIYSIDDINLFDDELLVNETIHESNFKFNKKLTKQVQKWSEINYPTLVKDDDVYYFIMTYPDNSVFVIVELLDKNLYIEDSILLRSLELYLDSLQWLIKENLDKSQGNQSYLDNQDFLYKEEGVA